MLSFVFLEREERERLEQEQREEEEREYQERLRKLEEQERKQRARQQEIEERERRREEERRTEEKTKVKMNGSNVAQCFPSQGHKVWLDNGYVLGSSQISAKHWRFVPTGLGRSR